MIFDNITLISVDTYDPDRTIHALNQSSSNIKFADVKLITSTKCNFCKENTNNINIIYNDSINSFKDFNKFMIFDIYKYIDTEFAMLIEWDGYILDHTKWDKRFLDYDYIGAPWVTDPDDMGKKIYQLNDIVDLKQGVVGNSGFSIRSKNLMDFLGTSGISRKHSRKQDMFICFYNRRLLMKHGFTFAPVNIADDFSAEMKPYNGQFGWHGFHNKSTLPTSLIETNKWIKNNTLETKVSIRLTGR